MVKFMGAQLLHSDKSLSNNFFKVFYLDICLVFINKPESCLYRQKQSMRDLLC